MPNSFSRYLDQLPHTVRHLDDGALLFERGDAIAGFCRVISGEIRLLRRQDDGNEFILQRARRGALVAEASLFSDCYHCAAVAVGKTDVMIFRRALVQELIRNDADAALAYAHHMARELQQARMRAEIASFRRVADRLDAWLVWHDGRMPRRGEWLSLAQEIGVSPEALYREMARRRAGDRP